MTAKPVVEWRHPILRWAGYAGLWPLSLLFGLFLVIRDVLRKFKPENRLETQPFIIVVGSIAVGGSGKTPIVEFLADGLHRRGFRVCVLNHGYRKAKPGLIEVYDGRELRARATDAGDESVMLGERFVAARLPIPVFASGNRREAIRQIASGKKPDVIILDDGLQDPTLNPDYTVGVLDADELSYPQWPLPVGRLRDRRKRWLRCDSRVVTKCDDSSQPVGDAVLMTWNPSALVRLSDRSPGHIDMFNGRRICAFAGIGHQRPFRRMVGRLADDHRADVEFVEFADHHAYHQQDMRSLVLRRADVYLTTHKDAVKIAELGLPSDMLEIFFYLDISISGGDDLIGNAANAVAVRN